MPIRGRAAVAALALAALAAACGGDEQLDGRRVIASPRPSGDVDTTLSPATTQGPRATATREARTPEPTRLPPAPPGSLAKARVKLTKLVEMDEPIALAVRRGDGALYVAEKGGRIRAVRAGEVSQEVALDISAQVTNSGEQGLLGLAFSPDGTKLYVNFTNNTGDTVVREYAFAAGRADVTSARTILTVDQPFANHNGGNLAFGPDGYLYIGLGDGGSGGDPMGNAQNREVLLGKMLRIDPAPSGTTGYSVPPDNPYVGRSGRDEIWSYGWRNPWRYSFDKATGDMWVGDVGQNAWEEIDFEPAGGGGGDNYGWDRMEGNHVHEGSPPNPHHGPIYEYANGSGNCAVTGGYVYRGARIDDLRGAYVFADFCAGRLRAFVQSDGAATEHRFLGPRTGNLASFGQDHRGELYVLSLAGGVFRIDPA